ncbi:Glu/Leu/Phe/Val dehydrogenase dimerization domain-containing protein [Rhodoblastus sp. 17X3]|uniref:Glu/Leu/Phe/Val dehydrogenase dimerization domain-containing protein n=1 Tax=Rhodoblastus sp. 17X3 TaxID=3047026 RepID=UPI0024B70654|nr:Glu/Leu/Phe/Val dehydrogenase dimerization domain-containing protein [Rhodoblastus sp. 17X3]MDI9849664.1 Glu/Leu/Phe/Val dehydrogenase dimerization domain-containing protein [Rhodoblastus sp. 17X3]
MERAAPHLGSLACLAETLRRPKRTLIVDVPIEIDDSSIGHFEGFRVQHSLARGPGKGAACLSAHRRFHPRLRTCFARSCRARALSLNFEP